jgi:hypothetical protein
MNRFANIQEFPTAAMRVVVRPNFDTLYSSGWLDLNKQPMVGARGRGELWGSNVRWQFSTLTCERFLG